MLQRLLFVAFLACHVVDALPAQTATATPYGTGCYSSRRSFYEMWQIGGQFDLAGSTSQPGGFTLINLGQTFLSLPFASSWHQPGSASVPLVLTDDSVVTVPLGFTMQLPTGPTTFIDVCSNGYVYLHGGNSAAFSPTVPAFLNGSERLCAFFADLLPAVGSVTFESAQSVGYLTFNSVPEFGGSGTVTFQVVFRAYGQIELLYGPNSIVSKNRLVGWTPGAALDPGPRDLSQPIAFTTDAFDGEPLALVASTRPVLGTVLQLAVTSMPAGVGGLVAIGAQQFGAGLDLANVGMTGCRQYASLDNVTLFPLATGAFGFQVPVPNVRTLLGITVYAQAAASAPGRNALQWVSSNGLALQLGLQ